MFRGSLNRVTGRRLNPSLTTTSAGILGFSAGPNVVVTTASMPQVANRQAPLGSLSTTSQPISTTAASSFPPQIPPPPISTTLSSTPPINPLIATNSNIELTPDSTGGRVAVVWLERWEDGPLTMDPSHVGHPMLYCFFA
ncbi:unnamed protein product [Protopolystoma xenopodis]|uniref:Uncharacterized protein n=1 Tax=Protopolystoma xenopodis TaxID=117903 RepID=A0A448WQR6_9PLAT|nr:unnamed protein product [Protopolystoma xenopodis]